MKRGFDMANNDNNKDVESRKTVVTRTISRKINTAPYETLDVGGTWQQEIDWSSKDELWNKTRKFDEYIQADFIQTFKSVVSGLGLSSLQNFDQKEESNAKKENDFDSLS